MKTSRKIVTFHQPFLLKGVDDSQPPGDYAVVTREEEIQGLLHTGWQRVETSLRLPSLDTNTLQEQFISISPTELAAALATDAKASASAFNT